MCAVIAAITGAVIFIPGAFAVHDEGVYQLDGNAQASDNSETPAMPSAAEDADNICAAFANTVANASTNPAGNDKCNVTAAMKAQLPSPTSSTRAAFVTDGSGPYTASQNNVDDQYTSGSGDPSDLSTWAYKNASPSNDKSDIQNAFAAEYTVSSCPGDPAHAGCNVGDKVVYFGGDRTSDSGDENTAFWFLQSPAQESLHGGCTSNNGCPFTVDGSAWNGIAAGTTGSNLATHVAANPGPDKCLWNPSNPSHSIYFPTGGTCGPQTGVNGPDGDTYGDILVVSAFTGGGVEPNITAYEWIGANSGYASAKGADNSACGTSACTLIKILSVSKGCSPTLSADAACAITNQAAQTVSGTQIVGQPQPITAPWLYTEKTGDNGQTGANACVTAANKMCPSIFFEGGINLTSLGLQSECTSTFVMDTRSSQSVNSSLQDLAVGQVGSCTTTLTTKAGDTTDTPENNGTPAPSPTSIGTGSVSSGTDTAAISVSGANSYSGTLTWFLCGPLASVPTSGPACDKTKGVPAGSAHFSESDGNTHYFVSGTATLTSAGQYCWTAHFAPDAGQNSQIIAKDDTGGSNECFTVAPVTPTLTTCSGTYTGTGTPAACVPATNVAFGSAIHDRARLSGLATEPGSGGGGTPGVYTTINPTTPGVDAGKITFTLNGPSSSGCGSVTNNSTTQGDTNPLSTPATGTGSVASTGNGVYGPVNYTPGAPGKYHWQATIDNLSNANPPAELSINNNLPQSENNATCTDTNEDVTVQQHPTSTQTTPVDGSGNTITTVLNGTNVYDHAIVTDTDSGGGSPTGTVDFYICNPSQVTGTGSSAHCAGTGSVGGSGGGTGSLVQSGVSLTAGPGADQSQATSTTAKQVDTVGVWCFRADYNPDTSVFTGSFDNTHDECFNVVDVGMTTAQTYTLTDSATITPSGPGATIGGTVMFTLYNTSNCSNASVFSDTETVPDQSTPYEADATTSYSATASKTLSWKVVYTPDNTATNKIVTESCNTENASITINNG
jgi:hypothetical protein